MPDWHNENMNMLIFLSNALALCRMNPEGQDKVLITNSYHMHAVLRTTYLSCGNMKFSTIHPVEFKPLNRPT